MAKPRATTFEVAQEIRRRVEEIPVEERRAHGIQAALGREYGLDRKVVHGIVNNHSYLKEYTPKPKREPKHKKLKPEQKEQIRVLASLGIYTVKQIAEEYGCTPRTIYSVLKGRSAK